MSTVGPLEKVNSRDCDEHYQHDDNVSIRVVPQLPQPPLHALVREAVGDVVHQQGAIWAAVAGIGCVLESPKAMAMYVPDRGLDSLAVHLDGPLILGF